MAIKYKFLNFNFTQIFGIAKYDRVLNKRLTKMKKN